VNRRIYWLACPGLLALLLGVGGCSRGPESAPAPPAEGPRSPSEKTYALKGTVRKVDLASGEVTIAHEAVPGFMPAMVMPFTIKDRSSLEDVRAGDEVEGALRVVSEAGSVKDYELADLTVTRPALAEPPPPIEAEATARVLKPGDPVPDFSITTQDGATLRLSELKGEVVALTFIYTRCPLPDFCPAVDAKFADLARRISASPGRAGHVRLLSISFDPEHDTPAVLRAHARLRGAKPPLWTFAVASHEELARVGPPLGLRYGPIDGQIEHNLCSALIAPDGTLARLDPGRDWAPADVARAIYSLIPAASR